MKIVRRRNNFGDFPRGDQSSVEPTRWKLNFSENPPALHNPEAKVFQASCGEAMAKEMPKTFLA